MIGLAMKLIHGPGIKAALLSLAPVDIAVAYVGADWETYLDLGALSQIVLSPTLGSNPSAVVGLVEKLGWANVHFLDNLHAKIYLGKQRAAVGSFNLTANGLSAEGLEEAGFVVDDGPALDGLRSLFNEYKKQAMAAYPDVVSKKAKLAQLRALWDRAIKTGVIRSDAGNVDFAAYVPAAADEIYVAWMWGGVKYNEDVVNPSMVKQSVSLLETDTIEKDRWMLCWTTRNDGLPDARCDPYWFHIDEIVSHGAIDAQYTRLAIERNDRCALTPPFELSGPVIAAFYAVLGSRRFPDFLGNVDTWSFDPTIAQLPAFFDAMRAELRKASGATATATTARSNEILRGQFASRIREAMDVSLQKKYVTYSIDGMLAKQHAVELAKSFVRPMGEQKSGLKKLAAAGALELSFESIMLEPQFAPLFSTIELECARFNLREVQGGRQPR